MLLWLQAFVWTLADLLFVYGMLYLIYGIGPLFGASLGNLRRWSGASWLIAIPTGMTIGFFFDLLFGTFLRGMGFKGPSLFFPWFTLLVGTCAAFAAAQLFARWLQNANSAWIKSFRDHPWLWLRARSFRIGLACLALLLLPALPILQPHRIEQTKEFIRIRPELKAIQNQWQRYGTQVEVIQFGGPPKLRLVVSGRQAFSSEAVQLLNAGPWPILEVRILGSGDARESDLAQAFPSISGVQSVVLDRTSFTEACLPAIASLPQLRVFRVLQCPSISAAALYEFRRDHPDVHIVHEKNPR